MGMRLIKWLIITAFVLDIACAQSLVRMNLPPQADQELRVVALFDEELPEGIPVVLGLMGYDIEGGITPYSFEWLLNGKVISTKDIAIFTPRKDDDLVLKVTDKNKCRATTAFNLKVAKGLPGKREKGGKIKVYPIVFKNDLYIQLPVDIQQNALLRIFDLNGSVVYQQNLESSTWLNINLIPGIYFISVKAGNVHKVEKIVAQ